MPQGEYSRVFRIGVIYGVLCAFFFSFLPSPAAASSEVRVLAVQFVGLEAPVRIQVPATDAAATLAALRQDPTVQFAEPDATYRVAALPANDTYFSEQWHLQKMGVPEAWMRSVGNQRVVVAVLDTGVDTTHPDLKENIWTNTREIVDGRDNDGNGYVDDVRGWNFYDNNNLVTPAFEAFTTTGVHHGTVIAGEIGALGGNGHGVAGVNWRVSIMPLRVLSSSGVGDIIHVVDGINYAIRNGANVISLSFTGPNRSAILDDAIRRAHDAGILVVAAAGNDLTQNGGTNLDTTPMYPACSDGPNGENWVVGVAATDEQDKKAPFSDYGRRCVDLSAPGTRIFSTKVVSNQAPGFTDYYGGNYSGTSLAAPLVAGAAALIKSANPSLTMAQVREILFASADGIDAANPLYAAKLGRGRVNLMRAMLMTPAAGVGTAPPVVPGLPAVVSTAPTGSVGVLTAGGVGSAPTVTLYTQGGEALSSFLAYAAGFRGGLEAHVADVDGDGNLDVITAPLSGVGPVRVFSLLGKLKREWYPISRTFAGGIALAVGDVTGDGVPDIVTAPRSKEQPRIRVYDGSGKKTAEFLVYDRTMTGGVLVTLGHTDTRGGLDIITIPAANAAPHVRISDHLGNRIGEFMSGEGTTRSSYMIAAGDVNGDGRADIATMDLQAGNMIRFSSADGVLVGEIEIEGFGPGFQYALGDMNGDGRADLVLGVQAKSRAVIRLYDVAGKSIGEIKLVDGDSPGSIRATPAYGLPL